MARLCCLDLDTFFVSVERLLDPSLIGKPVVVGAVGTRGVVTACSYEVRRLGVRSGMAISEARRLAPRAVYLPPRHNTYTPYAKRVREVLEGFTPVVQTASIDEFFLDFRGCERLYRRDGDLDDDATIERIAWEMREAVMAETGLPASCGLGVTRSVAKMASGMAKPAGVRMVRPGTELEVFRDAPVRKFPGIGPVMEAKLAEAGLFTLGQLVELGAGRQRGRFRRVSEGVQRALSGHRRELGRDRPAFREHDPDGLTLGSISNERTFLADVGDQRRILDQLRVLCERVCWRARKRSIRARTVTLKLRYSDFHTITRGRTLHPTNRESTVLACVSQLYREGRTRDLRIRLLGVQLSNLVGRDMQLSLPFGGPTERPQVGGAIDAVRERFGYDAIRFGTPRKSS
ncbi:MAG TPA: DNA polymerase IV [Myxococcota bacterium]|nr:DNA polymerase IV [Myxococcota bacterium]